MIQGTETLPIGDIISRRIPFVIPRYQRAYAWEEEEINDFINDIYTLYISRLKQPPEPMKHFFGGLFSVNIFAANTNSGSIYEVVDGQQRLATFIITISLIVKSIEQISIKAQQEGDSGTEQEASAYKEQIKRMLLYYDEVENGNLRPKLRLTLSKVDRIFFEQLINTPLEKVKNNATTDRRKPESHKKLKLALETIQKNLIEPILEDATRSLKEQLQLLLSLKQCVIDDCYVLHIVSNDRNETYPLFAVLNDRGKTLSDGELLRFRTLELLEGYSLLQEQVENYWDKILAGNPTHINQFLHSYYSSYIGKRASNRYLFDDLCKAFFNYSTSTVKAAQDAEDVEKRLADIEYSSTAFEKILSGEWPYDDSKVFDWDRNRLYRLVKVLKHSLCFPLLLSAYACLSEKDFSEIVNSLERFVFRYITIVGARPEPLSEIYFNYSIQLRNKSSDYRLNHLESELQQLMKTKAEDNIFSINLKEKMRYSEDSYRKRLIKHFLTTLEDYNSWFKNGSNGRPKATTTSSFDINQISIEHIYPQNAQIPINSLEKYKHQIGNLTCWSPNDNKAESNNLFLQKKNRYSQSTIELTRELSNLSDWKDTELLSREQKLLSMAIKIFAI
jgi:hypothetical protein